MKTAYRVFDWDYDGGDMYFKTLREAKKAYDNNLKESPNGNWRLYKDIENKDGFIGEECILSNDE